ncbi:MAG: flippase-like domain-containing protein [Leptolyngbya sp. SIO1E4]|nr:flippase-like domain-containing protein [Leptolyngbya sp. SIO1E4]
MIINVKLFIKVAISAVLLFILFTKLDWMHAWMQFNQLSISFIIYALAFYTCLQWLSCIRWQIILSPSGYDLPTYQLLGSYFAGMFLNIFLPGALGGDVYRVYQVAKETSDPELALVSVFLERFTGLAALSAMAVVGLVPAFELVGRWDIIVLFFGCVIALVGGTLLIANRSLLRLTAPYLERLRLTNVISRMAKIQHLLHQFAQHRQALALSTGLSLLLQFAIVYYHYLVARQLGISISFLELLVFIPIIVVITMLPISLGGLGLKEGLWIYLFTRVGQSAEEALSLSLIVMILSWLLSMPGAVILLLDSAGVKHIRNKVHLS